LRAGLILSEAAQDLLPMLALSHGLRRDEETLQAISYYAKLPEALPAESRVYVLDPMLATEAPRLRPSPCSTNSTVRTIHLVSFWLPGRRPNTCKTITHT